MDLVQNVNYTNKKIFEAQEDFTALTRGQLPKSRNEKPNDPQVFVVQQPMIIQQPIINTQPTPMMVQPQVIPQVLVIENSGNLPSHCNSAHPQTFFCPNCNVQRTSKINYKIGVGSWLCMLPLVFFPCFCPMCQDKIHHCPACDRRVGHHRFLACQKIIPIIIWK